MAIVWWTFTLKESTHLMYPCISHTPFSLYLLLSLIKYKLSCCLFLRTENPDDLSRITRWMKRKHLHHERGKKIYYVKYKYARLVQHWQSPVTDEIIKKTLTSLFCLPIKREMKKNIATKFLQARRNSKISRHCIETWYICCQKIIRQRSQLGYPGKKWRIQCN